MLDPIKRSLLGFKDRNGYEFSAEEVKMSEELLPTVHENGFEIKYFLRLHCVGGTWFACLCNLPDLKIPMVVFAQEVK